MKQPDASIARITNLVLEAKAGLGKTTFLAHLARERGYIHHFVELAPGHGGIVPGLRNLAAQLILAWELDPCWGKKVFPGVFSCPDFLQDLLAEAARKRDEVRPGEKIVLVIDALDEAGVPPERNVLGLPRALPRGVYLIASQRPMAIPLWVEGPRRVFRLKAASRENQADVRAYLEAAATWPGVVRVLAERGYTHGQFVTTLQEKCCGMWIYLCYVVGEIERGEWSPLDLETLPKGEWQYYARYWGRWKEQEGWHSTYLPLLSTLAATREVLPLSVLCVLAGVAAEPSVEHLLQEDWRPFLTIDQAGDGPRYRLYHTSLREFLEGKADLGRLKAAEQSLVAESKQATREAHTRIADRYLKAWGGLERGLLGLQEPEKRDLDGGYGLRHLAAHLESAGRVNDLHCLLRVEWVYKCEEKAPYCTTRQRLKGLLDRLVGRKRTRIRHRYKNAWYTARKEVGDVHGYLVDVARAWRLAETEYEMRGTQRAIGLQCRYSLITACVNNLERETLPALPAAVVKKGVQAPTALVALAPHLPEEMLQEALATVGKIENEYNRARALAGLAPRLPERLLQEALVTARRIENEDARARALVGLAPHLPEGMLEKALAAARKIKDKDIRARALVRLAPHLPEGMLEKALVAAKEIKDEDARAEALTGLVRYLPRSLKEEALQGALTAASKIEKEYVRIRALVGLMRCLPRSLKEEALQGALTAAGKIKSDYARAEALVGLAPYLSKSSREESLQVALAVARGIEDEDARVRALIGLAPHLPKPLKEKVLQEAMAAAVEIQWEDIRARTLAGLALHLPELLREEALRRALAAARKIKDEDIRARALVRLAPHLPEEMLEKALVAAKEIKDEDARAEALTGLALHLPEMLKERALREAMAAASEIKNEYTRARVLAGLVPHLPELLKGKALREAMAAASEIKNEDARARAFAGLVSYLIEWAEQEPTAAYGVWKDTLHTLARRTCLDLLSDFDALSSWIFALGGKEAIAETFRAIRDVGRWWPQGLDCRGSESVDGSKNVA
jgi:hypothetical protein